MFGLSFGEVLIILVIALLVLGPSRLPGLARGLGKTLREFRKATGDLRSSMEDEFYKLDQPPRVAASTPAAITPAASTPASPPEGTPPDPEPKA